MARPEAEPKTPLGARLREVRRYLGDDERETFAHSLNISRAALAYYERGERTPDAEVLAAYSSQYGINLNWLVTGTGEMFEAADDQLIKTDSVRDEIVVQLARLVIKLHQDAGITLRPEDVAVESANLYKVLSSKVSDLADDEEVEATFPLLEVHLKRKISSSIAAPGTGKRSAS